jgi:hypothetical protein
MQRAGLRTSDGTDLTVGSIAALDYLRRVGTALVGVATTIASVLRETSGPTDLTIGAIADGEFIKRSGSTVIGAAVPSPTFGESTVDFGSTFTDSASVTVTGQAWVAADSDIHAWFQDDSTADNTAGEHESMGESSRCVVTNRVVATGFNVDVYLSGPLAKGQFTLHWEGL